MVYEFPNGKAARSLSKRKEIKILHPCVWCATRFDFRTNFISHIHRDISEGVEATILVYVDDSKVMKKVTKEEDVEELQEDLNKKYDWGGKKLSIQR